MSKTDVLPASKETSTVTEAYGRVYKGAGAFFAALSCVLAVFFLVRILDLRLLYTDSSVRASVQSSLRAVAENRGWLVSDMQIRAVFPDHVRLIHRAHVRGKDPSECIDVSFDSDRIAPCVD